MRRAAALCLSAAAAMMISGATPAWARGSTPGSASGTVTDASGNPLAGVSVSIESADYSVAESMNTDAAGAWHFADLPPSDAVGTYRVCFDARQATGGTSTAGYLDGCYHEAPYAIDAATPITVSSGTDTSGLDDVLASAGEITGQLTTTDGTPIAGVRVSADGYDGNSTVTATGVTDENGLYQLGFDTNYDGIPDDFRLPIASYTIYFSTYAVPDYVSEIYQDDYVIEGVGLDGSDLTLVTPASGSPTEIDDELLPAATIDGRVTDSRGAGVANVRVELDRGTQAFDMGSTAADGSYTIGGLPPGTYGVCFDANGANDPSAPLGLLPQCYDDRDRQHPTDISVSTGQHVTGIDAHLVSAAAISGTITDLAGHPLSDQDVVLYQDGSVVNDDFSDTTGHYQLGSLTAGTYTVCFDEPGFRSPYNAQCYKRHGFDPSKGTPVVTTAGARTGHIDAALSVNDPNDTTPPTVATTEPSSRFATGVRLTTRYEATDVGSGVGNYDVRYRSIDATGKLGPFQTPRAWAGTVSTSEKLSGRAGWTYCFSSRARDLAGNTSAWTAAKCSAIPRDDRSMQADSAWTRARQRGSYRGTVTTSRRFGATLTARDLHGSHIAILVTACPGCGAFNVRVDGGGAVRLSAAGVQRHQRSLLALPAVPSGSHRVSIRLVSRKKPVYIDGIASTLR